MTASTSSKAIGDEEKAPTLLREITFLHTTCIMIGTVIGSGIFVSPVSIVSHCESVGLSLLVWLFSGIIIIFVALCYVELGCMFPKEGGEYEFHRILIPGQIAAFLVVWMRFLVVAPVFHAILALTTSQYLFKPLFSDCPVPANASKIIAIWVLGKKFIDVFFACICILRYFCRYIYEPINYT